MLSDRIGIFRNRHSNICEKFGTFPKFFGRSREVFAIMSDQFAFMWEIDLWKTRAAKSAERG